jgi:7,8-dihydro-6-hydroxymethylpterin dimethyltransferase
MIEDVVLSATESICPDCMRKIDAFRLMRGDEVILRKECPEHGSFETVIWRGNPLFGFWQRPKTPSYPKLPYTAVEKGCPWDCGLCPEHRQHTCTALIEVTQRCNLKCAYCFADAQEHHEKDPDPHTIELCYRRVLEAGGPYNVQLSGGEPTLREDLPEIVSLGRSLGFTFIQLNTNGLRLAADKNYLKRLKDAGVASIFLQFDGTSDAIYEKLRGRPLVHQKKLAVENCAEQGLGVVLVPTLVPGVNTHEVGAIIRFAVECMPTVRGVHFQPVSYFGRYPGPPQHSARITLPEIMTEIENQTGGDFKKEHFQPPGCENALCSFHGNFVLQLNGELKGWTRHDPESCCPPPGPAEAGAEKARRFVSRFWSGPPVIDKTDNGPCFGGWDEFLDRVRSWSLCISGMAFQDAWNLDLDRLRDCCIHVVDPRGGLIPFCAYNLTDSRGRSFYRAGGRI